MGNSPVDRDVNYMKETWGTVELITDYHSMTPNNDFLDKIFLDPENIFSYFI